MKRAALVCPCPLRWRRGETARRARALQGARATRIIVAIPLNLDLREQVGQLGFVAALSGFRSVVADFLFIQAHVAWERTEWSANVVVVPASDDAAAARHSLLGNGRVAHGVECQRRGVERSRAAAPRAAGSKRNANTSISAATSSSAASRTIRIVRSSTKQWRVFTATNTKTTCARLSTSKRRPRSPARRVTRSVSPPTNSRTSKAASAKPTSGCCIFTIVRRTGTAADVDQAA